MTGRTAEWDKARDKLKIEYNRDLTEKVFKRLRP